MLKDAVTWLCQSPRRLAVGAVVVLTVLLVGGSALFGHDRVGSSAGGSTPTASATAVAAAQVPNATPYVSAAVAFVRVWAQPRSGESATQWQTSLAPLSTAQLGDVLRSTDPARLPGVPPAGEPVVRFLTQTSALIAVPLSNGSSVLVTLVSGDAGPLVSDIQPNVGD